jgi:hypothetical protein
MTDQLWRSPNADVSPRVNGAVLAGAEGSARGGAAGGVVASGSGRISISTEPM